MRRSLMQIFRAPALYAAASLVGLVSALVADGVYDVLAWATLGSAVAAAGWYGLRKR